MKRPSELTAALALLPTAYAAFVAIDLPHLAAGILAAVVALLPWVVSLVVDVSHAASPGPALPPVETGEHEQVGLSHGNGSI